MGDHGPPGHPLATVDATGVDSLPALRCGTVMASTAPVPN